MKEAKLVDDQLVVGLLKKKIRGAKSQKYLIDGFPRNIAQAKLLERELKEMDLILNLHVDEDVLVQRLLERSKTSGRADDNPETIKKRIKTFHDETEPVIEYYKKFGKIKHIDSSKSVDEVYQQVRKAIKPNLIFFWGPPGVGKSSAAQALHKKTGYLYVDFEEFARQHKCKTQQEKTNKFIQYCNTVPHKCIVVDSFFTDLDQTKVFFTHFAEPQTIFFLNASKDDVMQNIHNYYKTEKERDYQKQCYRDFVAQRDQIYQFLHKKTYFKQIDASQTLNNIIFNCLEYLRPLTLVSFDHHNQDLSQEYYDLLEKQRGFITCDIDQMCEDEIERGTSLGRRMQAFQNSGQNIPPKFKIELVSKVMFNEPDNTKFLFYKFPSNQIEFTAFESELYPIDYLLSFQRKNQRHDYKGDLSPQIEFFANGKEIIIDDLSLSKLDYYINPQPKYGIIIGPQFSGKTTLSDQLKRQFGFEVIDWQPYLDDLKTKLSTEENPIEEVTYPMAENHFADRLDPAKNNLSKRPLLVFDGFYSAWTEEQLQKFINRLGLPQFVLSIQVSKDNLVKRTKIKKEAEELDEEALNLVQETLDKTARRQGWFREFSASNYGVKFYELDTNYSLDTTKNNLNLIFQKRVSVVYNYINKDIIETTQNQKLIFMNVCRSNQVTFVDV